DRRAARPAAYPSGLSGHDWFPAPGKKCPADFAFRAIAPPCGAVFAAIVDDPQMQGIPSVTWEDLFQIRFRLLYAPAAGQLPSLGQSMDVGVDREAWDAERLGHDDARCLVADAGQFLQFLEGLRHGASMFRQQEGG